jgi:hypothetical protein
MNESTPPSPPPPPSPPSSHHDDKDQLQDETLGPHMASRATTHVLFIIGGITLYEVLSIDLSMLALYLVSLFSFFTCMVFHSIGQNDGASTQSSFFSVGLSGSFCRNTYPDISWLQGVYIYIYHHETLSVVSQQHRILIQGIKRRHRAVIRIV